MKFQYFSDIHTEQYKSNPKKLMKILQKLKVCAPYLILAGDIGDPYSKIYQDFMTFLSQQFDYIFLICGNHEYYIKQGTMEAVHNKIKSFTSSLPNVIFLDNNVFHIPNSDISIFGATFWTDIIPEEQKDIQEYIADYVKIPDFTIEECKRLHYYSCQKLQEALDIIATRRFIVISHHLPSYLLIDEKYLSIKPSLNSSFATNISIATSKQIVAWVAGHTHTAIEKEKFYINPIGYKGENIKYDFNKIFELPYALTPNFLNREL